MSDWIERKNWFKPNLPDFAFVEIKGHSGDVKFGQVVDFCWDRDPDGEGTITHYRLISQFSSKIEELQSVPIKSRVPDDSVLLKFANIQNASLMMIWWEKFGILNFRKWLIELENQ